MKKLISVLVLVTVLFSAGALAEELRDRTDPFRFSAFKEAAYASDGAETVFTIVSGEGYAAALIKKDGHIYRAFADFDERAEKLCDALRSAGAIDDGGFPTEEWSSLQEYIMTLPVQCTEELTIVPFSQEELDAMVGKTITEVMSEPWDMGMMHYPENPGAGKDIVFPMVKGFCEYEMVINEPFEAYQERQARDHFDPVTMLSLRNYEDLTVRSVKYTGISTNTLELRYLADGTWANADEQEPVDWDLMLEIADTLVAAWENAEPDEKTKEDMIAKLTEEHPEAGEMIRQIVLSYHN